MSTWSPSSVARAGSWAASASSCRPWRWRIWRPLILTYFLWAIHCHLIATLLGRNTQLGSVPVAREETERSYVPVPERKEAEALRPLEKEEAQRGVDGDRQEAESGESQVPKRSEAALPLKRETPVPNLVTEKQTPDVTRETAAGQGSAETEWMRNVCTTIPDRTCGRAYVLTQLKTTFCSAAKVASTTTKDYFARISNGEVSIPPNAKYGAHEANWTRLDAVSPTARRTLLSSAEWTHVFFVRHVLQRFVSGYLDKIARGCSHPASDPVVRKHYEPHGFTCEKHSEIEAFVSLMERIPTDKWEGHFAPQTLLCSVQQFPYTDIIVADDTLNDKLKELSRKLGVSHPMEDGKTSSHGTDAQHKLVTLFEGKVDLISRILSLFPEDCTAFPAMCDVDDLLRTLKN